MSTDHTELFCQIKVKIVWPCLSLTPLWSRQNGARCMPRQIVAFTVFVQVVPEHGSALLGPETEAQVGEDRSTTLKQKSKRSNPLPSSFRQLIIPVPHQTRRTTKWRSYFPFPDFWKRFSPRAGRSRSEVRNGLRCRNSKPKITQHWSHSGLSTFGLISNVHGV